MSRVFIILLIVLLPMRGWSADRMAVDMAASELASHVIGAGQHNSMPEDCLLSIDSDASDAGLSLPMGDDERGCQACQLCMSLAPYEVLAAMSVAMQSIAVDLALVECFVSADRARAVKPPIS